VFRADPALLSVAVVGSDMAQRSLLVRALWFVFVGWWASFLVVNVAWLLMVTIVGIPFGIWLIDRVPFVQSLRRREISDDDGGDGGHSLFVRAVYFVFVGWWAGFLWGNVAIVLSNTIVGIPIGYVMLNWLPYVTSLSRQG